MDEQIGRCSRSTKTRTDHNSLEADFILNSKRPKLTRLICIGNTRDARDEIAFFASHTFLVEDSRIEQKSSFALQEGLNQRSLTKAAPAVFIKLNS